MMLPLIGLTKTYEVDAHADDGIASYTNSTLIPFVRLVKFGNQEVFNYAAETK
jgi:hypothetical protein